MLAGCSAWTPLVRAGRGRTSCSPAGVGGGGGRGVLTTGEHLGVLAEVQEHRWVFCEGDGSHGGCRRASWSCGGGAGGTKR